MTMNLALVCNVGGLALGMIGAVVLIASELKQSGTFIRYLERNDAQEGGAFSRSCSQKRWHVRQLLWIAKQCGTNDIRDMQQEALFDAAPRRALGLLLVFLSFLGQAVGNILSAL
jgi:hypothetical protein